MKNSIELSPLTASEVLTVSSSAFAHNKFIPSRYTCDGGNVNPSLIIDRIPEGTQSLALIVDDHDASNGLWVHWVVWNIPLTQRIEENSIPGEQGLNDFGKRAYGGPCPPSGIHRYFFKLYALDTVLDLPPDTTKTELEAAMHTHILGVGELIGLYQRNIWMNRH